ncbi:hypothetical protein FB565_002256 [Actinoplanes lutulentus]|uniref:hypothetical protein n=1 Tax=Actinoplanes lutulentus TaxID=1287878 RepID=UPI000DBA39DB|nr:hypothetical protein [Actinoplanes lutulentus]MBB2942543.1 hypothetical protein [Actinoplanes lutulentus]
MNPSRPPIWAAVITGLVAAVAVAAPALAADPRPDNASGATVALVSTTTTPGGKVNFTGTGFVNTDGTGSVVMVKIDDGVVRDAAGSDVFAEVKAADGTGTVTGSVTLPASVTGSGHWLRMLTGSGAAGDAVRSVHTELFTVEAAAATPAVTLASDTVTAGASLTASGAGYPASTTVTVKLDKTTILTTFTSGADGTFAGQAVPVPATAAEGAHTLHFLASPGVSVQVSFTVAAEETEEPGAVSATVTITASVPDTGALAIKVSSGSVALSTPQVTSELDALVSTGALPTVTVSDLRAANPGWSVSGQIGDFTGTAGTVDGKYLGWTPKVVTTSAGQQVTAGSAVAAGTGLKSASALATAASGAGRGTAALGAGLELRLPTTTAPGDYSATLTLTAI